MLSLAGQDQDCSSRTGSVFIPAAGRSIQLSDTELLLHVSSHTALTWDPGAKGQEGVYVHRQVLPGMLRYSAPVSSWSHLLPWADLGSLPTTTGNVVLTTRLDAANSAKLADTTELLDGLLPLPRSWDPAVGDRPAGLRSPVRAIRGGAAMVDMNNAHRRELGLNELEWDEDLAWAALRHCLYLDHDYITGGSGVGHQQLSSNPFFSGAKAIDRHQAAEIVHNLQDSDLQVALTRWIQTPFHREPPLHPQATKAGACATQGGARVMVVDMDIALEHPPFVYPAEGSEVPWLEFDGKEDPKPLPEGVDGPVGLPISVWWGSAWPDGVPLVEGSGTLRDAEGTELPVHFATGWWIEGGNRGATHMVPLEPLLPGTRYRWSMSVQIEGGVVLRRDGQFSTSAGADALGPEHDALTKELEPWVSAVNSSRVGAGLPPLRHRPLLSAAAAVSDCGNDLDLMRHVSNAMQTNWNWPTDLLRQYIASDDHTALTAEMLNDPQWIYYGLARTDDETCMIVSGPEV